MVSKKVRESNEYKGFNIRLETARQLGDSCDGKGVIKMLLWAKEDRDRVFDRVEGMTPTDYQDVTREFENAIDDIVTILRNKCQCRF